MRQLKAPEVLDIQVARCPQLEALPTSKAEVVKVIDCYLVKELDVLRAEKLLVHNCPVRRLHIPKAVELDLVNLNLQEIGPSPLKVKRLKISHMRMNYLPKSEGPYEHIELRYVDYLEKIEAQHAATIFVKGCPRVKIIQSNKVSRVTAVNCESLTDIPATAVVYLLVRHCPKLARFGPLAKAEEVEVEKCPVKRLEAPKSRTVVLQHCRKLENIVVAQDTELSHGDCPKLKATGIRKVDRAPKKKVR